ncbi:MAG: nucleoside hydrolase [Verrucomicrobia bacterium]|nr:nucleoside hydrolase [Verrucomicrobiota bacterium]MCH8528081.1 nucleoside hydrolase [Kiritimatiellia bacterium]
MTPLNGSINAPPPRRGGCPPAKPVILDTDIGSDIDDTWALAQLLHSPELDLKLLTTACGDTPYRARIAAKLLDLAGRSDVPVGVGLFQHVMTDAHRHQGPWVEDYPLERYPGTVLRDGVGAMIDTIRASPEPVTLIAIAPCFNIAEALRRAPDIAPRCHFVGMHGSIDSGYSPESPPVPENNVVQDVPGFRKVLEAGWASLRITPLDTCGRITLGGERYQRILAGQNPLVQACVENYRIWAKRVHWMTVDFDTERTSTLFDNVAVTLAYSTEHLDMETLRISCTDKGMTVRDPEGTPMEVALRWKDMDAFEEHITRRILGGP